MDVIFVCFFDFLERCTFAFLVFSFWLVGEADTFVLQVFLASSFDSSFFVDGVLFFLRAHSAVISRHVMDTGEKSREGRNFIDKTLLSLQENTDTHLGLLRERTPV